MDIPLRGGHEEKFLVPVLERFCASAWPIPSYTNVEGDTQNPVIEMYRCARAA